MESLPLPQVVKVVNTSRHRSLVTIEPCFPGYGTTIANSLRRVLLSSLPGAAVIAVKIEGVNHEFSTLPGIKEDVVDILLNLKRLRFKVASIEPVKLTLKASGEREVTAKDIKATSDVEVVSRDLHLATLTDKKASLEMELTVGQGRGYVPVENRDEQPTLELGQIAVDAIYTPIVRVGFNVEDVRVGQVTNFDRLTFDIETDGTITPIEALAEASKILVDHFNFIIAEGPGAALQAAPPPLEAAVGTEGTDREELPKQSKKRGRPKKEGANES